MRISIKIKKVYTYISNLNKTISPHTMYGPFLLKFVPYPIRLDNISQEISNKISIKQQMFRRFGISIVKFIYHPANFI